MNKKMIFAGLVARPVRTTVSILAVALEVVLILVIIGLTNGISNETGKRTEGVGADIFLQPPNSSLFLAISTSTMPVSVADELVRRVDSIKAIAPVLTLVNSSAGLEVIYGIRPESFNEMGHGFIWHKGGLFQDPDDVVVDDIYAQAKHVDVGDMVQLVGHTFRVSGIVEHGKGARLFLSYKMVEDMTGRQGKASAFFITLKDPTQVQAVMDQIKLILPEYSMIPMKEYTKLMMSNNMPALDAFFSTVIFVALAIGVLVIFLSMYTTITERTREIGILRSLGASKGFIVSLIFQESAAICLVGVVVGIAVSFLVARGVVWQFPTLVVLITPDWIFKASAFAVLSGIIGSFYPSIKAAAQDPVEALAYE
jgi:putative ABC transport system permease protein